jgi:peptidoglycan/LPS O-acetylase OafA/YrhL
MAASEVLALSTSNRLPAVDGLRAVAALWVVLFHISALSHATFPQVPGIDLFMRSGSTGVSLFLVLSGFCLFLPFAGGRIARFKVGEFFRRRFRRLAPAYYTSLVISLVLAIITAIPLGFPQLTLETGLWQLATHVTLTHSLFPQTFYALNGAYWSLGLEWQLYLALPLLVLGVRRFGLMPTLIFAIACNVVYRLCLGLAIDRGLLTAGSPLADVVLPNQLFGRWAEFALGMLAADLYASGRLLHLQRRVPVMMGAIVVLIPLSFMASRLELSHVLYGALFFTLLCVVLMSNNVVSRVLAWRPLVAIGTLSYSLYLVHQPVIQGVVAWFEVYQPSASPTAVFLWLLMLVPGILFLAWLLFITVERRTMGPNAAAALVPRWNLRLPSLGALARARQPTADVAD